MKYTLTRLAALLLTPLAALYAADAPSLTIQASAGTKMYDIELVVGNGTAVEGQPATQCKISQPFGIAFDPQDNMYICEETSRILRVDAKTGILTIVSRAHPKDAPLGDGKPACDASFVAPHNLVADAQGNLFIADTYHYSVRRVDAKTGIVTTFAGNGTKQLSGDGGPAASAGLDGIACLCFSSDYSQLYLGGFSKATVSYTHLTLPTKRIV